ncbi:MAG TPA: amidohydrolase [Nocardioides sp.]|uniref:amidohydrolase n=1 Tax=uncultured Nocardioides sp. TaxID=198441 RepID=UPI000EEC739F|nr:amidohydrolase [uncultured Nocardioides sp.]HCB06372.1 amidohydrolase [Nocardioides sp.]HRI95801.1 amidohydrolase [Nocardioides sp.]
MPTHDPTATGVIADVVEKYDTDLVELRRDLHRHPELSWSELRTAQRTSALVEEAGWTLRRYSRTGFAADLGSGESLVALRADMDALPVQDLTEDPWVSSVPGVAHACGHDVHTSALVGAALALAEVHGRGLLPGRVRLLFQPAEEVMPGGAVHLMDEGALDDVERVFALHCDPGVDVGQVGLRLGPLTSAADRVEVRLTGTGGHTSRPHLTGDLTFALAKVTTELPAVLSRRMDPRAGVSVVWGSLHAGSAPNVIPDHGLVTGTVRILDAVAWADCEGVVREVVADIVRPYGVTAEIDYQRGVPPVVNDPVSNRILAEAVRTVLGESGQVVAPQSLGGEDFGWYLDRVPGAMMRLGTRTPGGATYDLHQGNLLVDERATGIGARLLAETAVQALAR